MPGFDRKLAARGGQRARGDRPGLAVVIGRVGQAALEEDVTIVGSLSRGGEKEKRRPVTGEASSQGADGRVGW